MAADNLRKWIIGSKPVLSMLLVQVFVSGMQLLSRAVLTKGIFILALIAYRHVVAALCMIPFAFYFERDAAKKMRLYVWFWLFLNASVGITMAMGFYYYGLRDTSATYSINFLNLLPVCTFLVSIILRLEKVGLRKFPGKIKTLGAILCVGGALCTSLYQGKVFYIGNHSVSTHTISETHETNWGRGTIFLICSCLSFTAWYLIQVRLFELFPCKYWTTMLTCIIASLQAAAVGLCITREKTAWKIGWNLQLLTIVYSGALATAATYCLISWTIAIQGPTYPPMFNPLALIFVAFSEAIILGEPLRLGTLLGMVLIILGLYSFLWGKTKLTKSTSQEIVVTGKIKISESAAAQVSATVVPSNSPSNSDGQEATIDIEKAS